VWRGGVWPAHRRLRTRLSLSARPGAVLRSAQRDVAGGLAVPWRGAVAHVESGRSLPSLRAVCGVRSVSGLGADGERGSGETSELSLSCGPAARGGVSEAWHGSTVGGLMSKGPESRERKSYSKPELDVVELLAGEAVLTACKVPGTRGSGFRLRIGLEPVPSRQPSGVPAPPPAGGWCHSRSTSAGSWSSRFPATISGLSRRPRSWTSSGVCADAGELGLRSTGGLDPRAHGARADSGAWIEHAALPAQR